MLLREDKSWKKEEKKQSSFASAIGLCFFYLPNFLLAQVRRRAQLVRLFCSAEPKEICRSFSFFKVRQRARLVSLFVFVQRKIPQPECR